MNQHTYRRGLRALTDSDWKIGVFVFLSYFATAKLAQYILYALDTSPALIWAPAGIALAAVVLKGNKMGIPIALAHALSIITLTGIDVPITNVVLSTLGHTLQPLIGARILYAMGNNGTIHKIRDVLVLIGFSFIIAAIAPFISTLGQVLFETLRVSPWVTFSRTWVGGILGIIVVTPFVTGWCHSPSWPMQRKQLAEAVAAFGLLLVAIYSLFWVSIPALVFAFIFLLCVTHFWIAFRFGSRVNTSALLLLTVLAILGSIIANPSATPLSRQLFADELFIILLAPIFLLFFAMAEERRQTTIRINAKVSELEEITHQLAINDSAKNEFIAILAHELRNPLSTIVSTLEVIKLEKLSGDSTAMVARAEQQAFGMRRLLDDLLDVARITEKKFDIVPEQTNLRTVIDVAVQSTNEARATKGQMIRVWMPENTVQLTVDPVRMEQVLVNLLNNAVKYSPEGSTVEILCSVDKDQLRIAIKDDGDGIPTERLEAIFSPFQQLGSATQRASGVGMGLFLTRQIVEMHGGTITAHSAGQGTGSTFTILLPINNFVNTPEVEPAEQIETPTVNEVTTKHILVVDDNDVAATGMCRLLVHHGYDVDVANTGTDALTMVGERAPDAILLDIGLPDISGHEVAKRIRATGDTKTILIALTGYGQESDKEEAFAAGFNHHLTKPVSITEVIVILNKV